MEDKKVTLETLGVIIKEITLTDIIMEKDGKYIKYMKYCYDNWHHDNVMKDVLDQFREVDVDIRPVIIDRYRDRKDNIRKKLTL